uniref:Uncharacterized protein n=1 Tax=Parascaris equorum TaxID=6256 RepID=A0A914S5T8_PAREQ
MISKLKLLRFVIMNRMTTFSNGSFCRKLLNYSHISAQFCYLFRNELLISITISTIIYKKNLICCRSTISNVTPTPLQCATY